MAEPEDEAAEALRRIEAALERIAHHVTRRPAEGPGPERAKLAARLDTLIAQLRAALDGAVEAETTESR
jgi:hypothetical protein